ncbi:MAG TPA: TonB-dependent receptor [bacterium]
MKRSLLTIFFIFIFHNLFAAEEIITFNIIHDPVSAAKFLSDIEIKASISPSNKVSYISLNYRLEGEISYKVIFMEKVEKELFRAIIPKDKVIPPVIEYFIVVMDIKGISHIIFRDPKNPQKIELGEEAPQVSGPAETGIEEEFALFAAEDVVYGAAKHEQKLSEAPASVTVISDKDIKNLGIISIPELLKYIAGLDQMILNPTFSFAGIRGLATRGNLLLVLVDGREVNIEFLGFPLWDALPVSLSEIKAIEIIRGPGSALYGANAFSGVINIITKSHKDVNGGYLDVRSGSYHTSYVFGMAGFSKENSGMLVTGESGRANKWSKPNEASLSGVRMNARMDYTLGETNFSFNTGHTIGQNLFFTALGPFDADGDFKYFKANLDHGELKTQIYWTGIGISSLIAKLPGIPPVPEMQALIPPITGDLNQYDFYTQYAITGVPWNRLTFGGVYRFNTYLMNILPDRIEREARAGLFLQDEFRPAENLILTLGYRYDWNSRTPAAQSPRINITYSPFATGTFRLSYGRAFRKPSFFEYGLEVAPLKEALGVTFSNPDLSNESVTTYEVGYVGTFFKKIKTNSAVFYNQYRDFIEYDPTELKYKNLNTDADTYGGEIEIKYEITKNAAFFTNLSYLKAIDRAADRPPISVPPDESNPNFKFAVGQMWSEIANTFGSIVLTAVDGFKKDMPDPNNTTLILLPKAITYTVDPYILLNVKLGYRFYQDKVEIGVYGYNLLFQKHREFPGVKWNKDTDGDGIVDYWEIFGGEEIGTKILGFIGVNL